VVENFQQRSFLFRDLCRFEDGGFNVGRHGEGQRRKAQLLGHEATAILTNVRFNSLPQNLLPDNLVNNLVPF
jgi:hypothetical protein